MAGFTTTTTETWVTFEEEYTYGPDTAQMDQIAAGYGPSLQFGGALYHQYTVVTSQGLGLGAMLRWEITDIKTAWGPNISPVPNSECPIPNDPVVTFEQLPHTFQSSPGAPYPHCTVNLIPQPDVRNFDRSTKGPSGGSSNYRYGAEISRSFKIISQPLIGTIVCDGTTCTYTYPLESLFGPKGLDGKQTWQQHEKVFVDLGVHSINTIKYTNKYIVNHSSNGTCFWERCACSDFGLWNTQQACAAATTNGVIYADHPKCSTPEEGAWSVNAAGKPCMFTTPGPQGCCWTY